MSSKIFFLTLIVLILIPQFCFGLTVTAHVDKYKISQEDSVLLNVDVDGGKADIDVSMVKDFKIISRGTSISSNYINGKYSSTATYQYILLPLSNGELKIPAIRAKRKGQTAFTKEITVFVTDHIAEPGKVKALFAKSFVTKDELFTGEQTIFTLKFFTSKKLSSIGFESAPEFKGFFAKQFEHEKTYSQIINGIQFNVTEVNYLIIPSNPGTFTIDPAVLIAKVIKRSGFNDSFFFSDRSTPVRVISNPVEIKVLSLPQFQGFKNFDLYNFDNQNQSLQGNKAIKFSGLTGKFNIISNIDKTNLKAGESATLTIKISGTGNIMDAGLPQMDFDQNVFKVYDDNPVDKIELSQQGYTGYKIFKKAIVPIKPGKFKIKPHFLVYFDVDKKDFQLISTESIMLDVVPSQENHLAVQPQTFKKDKALVQKKVAFVNKDILEIKEGLNVLKNYTKINFSLFVLLLFIPAFFFSGVKLFTIIRKKEISIEKQMKAKAKLNLKKAKKLHKKDKDMEVLNCLYTGVIFSILAKGHKKGETITIDEAQTILKESNTDKEKIMQIISLLENIEAIHFGGKILDKNMANELLSKTTKIIKMICIAVLCFTFFTLTPQTAVADDSTAIFSGAIKDYKTGDFLAAAKKFETIAQNNIKNPYLYYNIGNAYFKTGDTGHAILWYERAKKILVNDPDLNFNLNYARGFVKDKKEDPIRISDILFFRNNLIPVKFIQITALSLSFLFFIFASIQIVRREKIFSGFGILLFSIFIIFTAIVFADYYKQAVVSNAVIVKKEAVIRSGISDTSTKLFTLHAGTKIRVTEQRNGYLKIKFSKDKIGWVSTDQAVVI